MPDKQKIYISLLPLFVIILLIIGAGYFLLVDEIKLPTFNKGPQIRRIEGFPTSVVVDPATKMDKQRLVIQAEHELNTFLNNVDKTGMLTMREKIDFNKEYVIAVGSEVEQAVGHRIKIRKVYENKAEKSLLVSLVETYPGEKCTPEVNPHVAVDLVAINKTDWNITFERIKDTEECSANETSTSN
jgi:hypothetical protein